MFGSRYKNDYETSVKELSAIELVLCEINDDLDDHLKEKDSKDDIVKDLLRINTLALKNNAISDRRAVRLTRLITNISLIIKENAELRKEATT